jgi:tripartite-type tricarboxylate transporter receptor subunit TctC
MAAQARGLYCFPAYETKVIMRVTPIGLPAAVFAAALLLAQVTAAQTPPTLSGPVTIYVAGTAGGGIDLFGRLVGRHLGQHLPGHPTVTVEDMPGAGGIRAANFLARQAPRDGTVMTTFAGGPVLEPLIGARNPGYDMSQFTWIGALTRDVGLCLSWGSSPFKTIEDVRSHVMVVAGTGAGSETDTWPVIINEALGTKFKVVTGYLGTQETLLAMERGEANGRCILSLSALKAAKPDWISEKKVNILLQVGLAKNLELAGVPLLLDLVKSDDDRQMLRLLSAPTAMARPFAGPPGLNAATANTLRRAFDATAADPEFLAEAKQMQAEIAPTRGEDVQRLVAEIYATPSPIVGRAKKFFAP